ncbi:MAG: hypothetical protein AAF438_20860 [Pseudomonadota bacterium]
MTDTLLYASGALGVLISLVHGYLGETKVVVPSEAPNPSAKRVLHAIMVLSAVYWFAAAVLLLVTPEFVSVSARPYVVYGVAAVFLSGSVGNLWATRGRHPGWALLAIAAGLAVAGV